MNTSQRPKVLRASEVERLLDTNSYRFIADKILVNIKNVVRAVASPYQSDISVFHQLK
ncbi:hypothetical protein [Pontibacter sp. H249]|uniref:hypothetical protein n=1 Tax=Pontibacter sp. H249 TaxID=3133420 RepID=UPI0030BA5334